MTEFLAFVLSLRFIMLQRTQVVRKYVDLHARHQRPHLGMSHQGTLQTSGGINEAQSGPTKSQVHSDQPSIASQRPCVSMVVTATNTLRFGVRHVLSSLWLWWQIMCQSIRSLMATDTCNNVSMPRASSDMAAGSHCLAPVPSVAYSGVTVRCQTELGFKKSANGRLFCVCTRSRGPETNERRN